MRLRLRLEWVLVATQVAAAAFVLGLPDGRQALDFLGGGYPTGLNVIAATALLLWAVVLVGAVVVVVAEIRRHRRHLVTGRTTAGLLLVIGTVVLIGGVIRHQRPAYTMCCGTFAEAQQARHELGGR
jgi:amino acid transporter